MQSTSFRAGKKRMNKIHVKGHGLEGTSGSREQRRMLLVNLNGNLTGIRGKALLNSVRVMQVMMMMKLRLYFILHLEGNDSLTGLLTVLEISAQPEFASERQALGLSASGLLSLEEIKCAYRTCALKWHPDRHQGSSKVAAEEKFKHCSAAYKTLCDKLAMG